GTCRMRNGSLIAAASVVLVANGFALVHAARNRSGEPDADVVLTDRELNYIKDSDDSGVALRLNWQNPNAGLYLAPIHDVKGEEDLSFIWLDQQKLVSLGFDCSIAPSALRADEFYRRQRPRAVFVALEYE